MRAGKLRRMRHNRLETGRLPIEQVWFATMHISSVLSKAMESGWCFGTAIFSRRKGQIDVICIMRDVLEERIVIRVGGVGYLLDEMHLTSSPSRHH